MDRERKLCSICHKDYIEFGNTAWPVNTGRCCNRCNDFVVIPARIARMRMRQEEKDEAASSA